MKITKSDVPKNESPIQGTKSWRTDLLSPFSRKNKEQNTISAVKHSNVLLKSFHTIFIKLIVHVQGLETQFDLYNLFMGKYYKV